MTSHKFAAARLHQMRAGKSYLRAQGDWRNRDEGSICPRCENTNETFYHVINECPSLATAREGHSNISLDISPESLVWSEKKKGWEEMKHLISFISLNKINFPLKMDAVPFTRADQVQS